MAKKKPHRGRIQKWSIENGGGHKFIVGLFVDHPEYREDVPKISSAVTSLSPSADGCTLDVETQNSRYRLDGPCQEH